MTLIEAMTLAEIKKLVEIEKEKLGQELSTENEELKKYADFFTDYNLNDVRNYDKVDTSRFFILYLHSVNPSKWSMEELETMVAKNKKLFQESDSIVFRKLIDLARDIVEAGAADILRELSREPKRSHISIFQFIKSKRISEIAKKSLENLKEEGYDLENLIDLIEKEDEDLCHALSLVSMFKESKEIKNDIKEQMLEFAEENNLSPSDRVFQKTADKYMNLSVKKDEVFKLFEVMQEYYKRLLSKEKSRQQQAKKGLKNYQQFENLFAKAIKSKEITNYEEIIESIASPQLRIEVLKFIYRHNLQYQQQLYTTYQSIFDDNTMPYKAFISRYSLSIKNLEALMTKSIEELEKMLKEISALNIQNKEQILEGSNLARISKLKELMKKGIITEEFLNKNSSLFQIEQPEYQNLTTNLAFLKEKRLAPLTIAKHRELLLIPAQTLSENYHTLEEYELPIDWDKIESANFLGSSDLEEKIDKLLELGYENILETNLELLNYSKEELERLEKLKILSFPLPETIEELNFVLSSKHFIIDNQELIDDMPSHISTGQKRHIKSELEESLQGLEYTKRTYKVGDNIFSKQKTLRNLSVEEEITPRVIFKSMVSGTRLSPIETEIVEKSLQGYNYKK